VETKWDKSKVLLGMSLETTWEFGEPFWNLITTPWEHDGNTLGIFLKEKKKNLIVCLNCCYMLLVSLYLFIFGY
jgi:hypothetical protein